MSHRSKVPGNIRGWSTTTGKINPLHCPNRRYHVRPNEYGLVCGMRLRYWAILAAGLVAIAFALTARAGDMTVRPFMMYQHQSDIMRGPPFFKGGTYEPTNDYAALGATFAWPHWELDVSHGAKSIDCAYVVAHAPCKWQSGSEVSARFYPWVRK